MASMTPSIVDFHFPPPPLPQVFDNVEKLLFKKIFVEDTLKLRATNVKEARFVQSSFAHIPREGFQVSRAIVLDIRQGSREQRTEPGF